MAEINFKAAEEKQEFDIVETKEWKDRNTGMTVIEHIPLQIAKKDKHSLEPDKKTVRYGKAHIQVPQVGPIAFQFIFPEEFDLLECFEHFEEYAEMAVNEMEREANQQIVIPHGMNSNALRAK